MAITVFDRDLSDPTDTTNVVTQAVASRLFAYFKESRLFRWQDAHNDCEDRANAICMLLDTWGIPNYKAWVFSGAFLKRGTGSLVNTWNYHVAAALPVNNGTGFSILVIDPATRSTLETIETWAAGITQSPYSFYLVKDGCFYIFDPAGIRQHKWYRRNRQNFKWTMQGLAGINGVARYGKAQLVFDKKRIKKAHERFREAMQQRPFLEE